MIYKIFFQYEPDGSVLWFHPAVGFCECSSLANLFAECALEFGESFALYQCEADEWDSVRDCGFLDYEIGGAQ